MKGKSVVVSLCCIMLLLTVSIVALAAPATYTFEGTASGSIQGLTLSNFTDANFTLTLTGDTSSITGNGTSDPYQLILTGAGLNILGYGSGTVSQSTALFAVPEGSHGPTVGWRGWPGADYLDVHNGSAYYWYDLSYDLQFFDPSPFAIDQFSGVHTAFGDVTFTSAKDVTFTALTGTSTPSLVPTPPSVVLLATALASIAGIRRKFSS
jgi:hypothetical protein